MQNLNVVVLAGRLVKDMSEGYKKSESGTAYGNFTIAVNRAKKGPDGVWKDEASFVDCRGVGRDYDFAALRCKKGDMVSISGHIEQEKWQSKDGKNMSKIVVVADKFFLEWKKQEGQGKAEQQAPQAEGFTEDLPF